MDIQLGSRDTLARRFEFRESLVASLSVFLSGGSGILDEIVGSGCCVLIDIGWHVARRVRWAGPVIRLHRGGVVAVESWLLLPLVGGPVWVGAGTNSVLGCHVTQASAP